MKIAIAGAGAMGSKFGWHLSRHNNNVILIDGWDKNIEAVRNHGVIAEIDGEEIAQKIPIYNPKEIDEKHDAVNLLIVFTKSMQLDAMLDSLKPIISKDTYVLCLLNGLGHEEVINKYVAMDHIIMGVTMWASNMIAPGKIKFANDNGDVEIQCLTDSGKNETKNIAKILNDAGLNAKYSENVMYAIWRKACVNGVVNSLCALLGTNCQEFGQTPKADLLTRKIVQEFADVAQFEGVNLDRAEVIKHVESLFTVGHYPSMYQDLVQNKRPTEIDYINGAVWNKGKKYSVATPFCELITYLIHTKETVLGV